jgi:hypothetical protein
LAEAVPESTSKETENSGVFETREAESGELNLSTNLIPISFVTSKPRVVSRSVSQSNFLAFLAGNARKDKTSLGYKVFRRGLLDDESDSVLCDFRETLERVKRGYSTMMNRNDLFEQYRLSRRHTENSEDQTVRIKASRYSWKGAQECIKSMIRHGVSCFAVSVIENVVQFSNTSLATKFDRFLLIKTGMTLAQIIKHVDAYPEDSFIVPKISTVSFSNLNSKSMKSHLRDKLLDTYRSDCNCPEAREIPWSRVDVIGWPSGVPLGMNLTKTNLKKVYDVFLAGEIVFRLL